MYPKIFGVSLTVVAAVFALVRCVPSETANGSSNNEVVSKAREAEAAEEALAAAAKASAAAEEAEQAAKKKKGEKANTKTASKAVAKAEHKAEAKPEKKAETKPAAKAAVSRNNVYVVQIGAFKVKENAEKLVKKLKDAGYPVRMQSLTHSKNGELHLVRFEPTQNKTEAEDAVEKLHAKESLVAQLLTLPAEG